MKTINLLPKIRQQELHYESLLHGLWIMIILSGLSFALVFLFQFGVKFYLEAKVKNINSEIAMLQNQVNKEEDTQVKAAILQANNSIADFKNLATAAPKWSKVIKAFAPLPPPGVKINSFYVNITTMSVSITGLAPTRELVIQLYNNILADKKEFYNIDYPFENIVNPTNIGFHFSFYMNKDLLK